MEASTLLNRSHPKSRFWDIRLLRTRFNRERRESLHCFMRVSRAASPWFAQRIDYRLGSDDGISERLQKNYTIKGVVHIQQECTYSYMEGKTAAHKGSRTT